MAKILIVDDNPALIEEVSGILLAAGHHIESRQETAGLNKAVREIVPDLIVLDINFPNDPHGGIKAARALTEDPQLCRIPILMLSGINRSAKFPFSISESDISEDFLPIDAFIDKPVQAAQLQQKVDDLLYPDGKPPIARCKTED